MTRRAALLRGVNLGGRTLRMEDLRDTASALGFARAGTLLASGNLLLDSDLDAGEIERRLEAGLAARGLVTDVIVRDADELRAVIAANPYPAAARDHPSHLLVTFHRATFPAELIATAAALNPGGERMAAVARELYVDHLGREEMRSSKLTGAMRKARFPAIATARNWNTVVKLAAALDKRSD